MSGKPSKIDALTHPIYHVGSGKIESVGRVSPDGMNQKMALSGTSHQDKKDGAAHAQPNSSAGRDRRSSPSSAASAQTSWSRSSKNPTSVAMDRWQKETPQEQYWNSEGYHAKK